MTIRERTSEIEALQKSLHEAESRMMMHESKLRQEFERTLTMTRREYEEKLRTLEIKIQKYEKNIAEYKFHSSSIQRLEDEVLDWQRKYQFLERQKPKEVIKEVIVEKPVKIEKEIVKRFFFCAVKLSNR